MAKRRAIVPELLDKRILIVEDEAIVALTLEVEFQEAGAQVIGPADTLSKAMELSETEIDAAILDINLGGDKVFPVARRLRSRDIPFVFASATCEEIDAFAGEFEQAPRFGKPIRMDDMIAVVGELLAQSPAAAGVDG